MANSIGSFLVGVSALFYHQTVIRNSVVTFQVLTFAKKMPLFSMPVWGYTWERSKSQQYVCFCLPCIRCQWDHLVSYMAFNGQNSPSEQPWISKEEEEYIELSLTGDLQSKVWKPRTWLVSQNYHQWSQKDRVVQWLTVSLTEWRTA